MKQILIGADPELFVGDDSGVFINGFGMIPGDKSSPFRVKDGAVQVDGMALEFNIDPATSREDFVSKVFSVKEQLKAMLKPGLNLLDTPVVEFSKEFFDDQPSKSKEMGCDPDFNAWTGSYNPDPEGGALLRTGAGHIHIGWTSGADPHDYDHFQQCCDLVKHLDSTVGLWTVVVDPESAGRRQLYGKAGAFRPKSYGLEWRVPSNFWTKSPELAGEMYDRVFNEVQRFFSGEVSLNQMSESIINSSDVAEARRSIAA